MIINNYIRIALAAGAFVGGWHVNGLRYDSIIADEREQQVQALNDARGRADDAEHLAAKTRATIVEKEKVITRDIIKYVKTTERTVCVYDDKRMHIKADILRATDPRVKPVN